MRVAGLRVAPLSGASLPQLELLAGAFQLLPYPSSDELLVVARHVGVPPEQLAVWFKSRRALEGWWARQQPHLQPVDVVRLFYPDPDENREKAEQPA